MGARRDTMEATCSQDSQDPVIFILPTTVKPTAIGSQFQMDLLRQCLVEDLMRGALSTIYSLFLHLNASIFVTKKKQK